MLFDFLFGKKKTPEADPQAADAAPLPTTAAERAAPGTTINFSADLVPQLKADHQALLATFGQIKQAHEAGKLAEVSAGLEHFRSQMMAHLLKENVRFYIYLEHALAADPASQGLVHEFRQEMNGIGKAVMAFLDKYRQIAIDTSLAGSFGADLSSVGSVLVQRIHNEEEALYPLYLPAY